ncbi:MAG: hypothetical protein LBQ33_00845 [Oscillospiraceae bacterium]|jgi:hypothetical protein|nr:hypothetical protein [Oscillospiraceae bacterium]
MAAGSIALLVLIGVLGIGAVALACNAEAVLRFERRVLLSLASSVRRYREELEEEQRLLSGASSDVPAREGTPAVAAAQGKPPRKSAQKNKGIRAA